MKQYIVLISMIMLGVILVNLIVGENGIGTIARGIWSSSYQLRTETFKESND